MLRELKLSYFRQHQDRTFTFGDGLQIIRAPNEGGKTTALEAFGYAIGGTKMLNDTLAETVTWGHKESKLSVSATIEFDGHNYLFKRSKAGAEVYVDDSDKPFVTGQAEVTNFAASLFRVPSSAITSMMISSQGGLGKILEDKGKAATTLIESLADLNVIERMIDVANQTLVVASPASLKLKREALAETAAAIEALVEVPAPDESEHSEFVSAAQFEIDSAEKTALEFKREAERLNGEIQHKKQAVTAKKILSSKASALKLKIDQLTDSLNAEKVLAEQALPVRSSTDLALIIKGAETWQEKRAAYLRYQRDIAAQNEVPRMVRTEWESELSGYREIERQNQLEFGKLSDRKAALKKQLGDGKCPQCGQEIADKVALAEKAAAEIKVIDADLNEVRTRDAVNDQHLSRLKAFEANDAKLRALKISGASFNLDMIPGTWQWVGEVPDSEGPDSSALKSELVEVRSIERAIHAASVNVESYTKQLAEALKNQAFTNAEIESYGEIDESDIEQLIELRQEKLTAETANQTKAATWRANLGAIVSKFKAEKAACEAYFREKRALGAAHRKLTEEIRLIEFNAGIIRKLREARPQIANQLWSSLLAATSLTFSRMRGVDSIITRDSEGFRVNGHSVGSLSGSARDILGLAIRATLIKVFSPQSSFMILDEPAAACDADRTVELIGFIAACSFKQVIMVSHEEISSAVANNIIQL